LWNLKAPLYHLFRKPWPLSYIHKRERRNILELLAKIPPQTGLGLDLGCGSGESLPLAPRGLTMFGIDASYKMARLTQTKHQVPVMVAGATALPLRPRSCAYVMAIGLLEYLADISAFFSECSAVLQHGGYLLVTSSPAGAFTTGRKIGGATIFSRTAQVVIAYARQHGLDCIAVKTFFPQEAFLLKKIGNKQQL